MKLTILLLLATLMLACNKSGGGSSPTQPLKKGDANSIYGTWYIPYTKNTDTFNPESLTTVDDDGTLTTETVFPGKTEKQISKFKVTVTGDSISMTSVISITKCDGTSIEPSSQPLKYTVNGSTVVIQMGESSLKSERATADQLKKFADLKEGCN